MTDVLEIDPHELERELGRADFRHFVGLMRPEYSLHWYHEVIVEEVQAWADAEKPYHLIMSMPPGHAKSEYAKLAMAWIATRDRTMQQVYCSYGQDLADEQLRDVQDILDSDEYLRWYTPALNAKRAVTDASRGAKRTGDYAELLPDEDGINGGWIKSVGRGGPLTGYRVDVGVVDDLIKDAEEGSSPTIRQRAWTWLTRVLMTRKRPHRALRLLVLATRWHMDDPTGRLLKEQPHKCVEVRFEALREDMADERDPRGYGEALWPAVADEEALQEMRTIDPHGFMALYQQRPVPATGQLFSEEWLGRYEALPSGVGQWVQSWDLRHGGKGAATSFAVGQLWYKPSSHAAAYLVDQVRGRWSPEETLSVFDAQQQDPRWSQAQAILVEEKADGVMLLSLRRSIVKGMIPVKPVADKEARARLVQPYVRAGNVIVPMRASWLAEWLGEICTFPGAPHDDQVDAMSQALTYLYQGRRPAISKVVVGR